MNDLTGTGALVRLILRRDRIRILIWVVSITLLVFLTVVGVKSLFPTQASIDQAAAATQHNAGAIAFNGPAQGLDTLGGQIAFQIGALGMVVVALMSVFMIGRLTRGDEEAGRLELVRSLPVGNHSADFRGADRRGGDERRRGGAFLRLPPRGRFADRRVARAGRLVRGHGCGLATRSGSS